MDAIGPEMDFTLQTNRNKWEKKTSEEYLSNTTPEFHILDLKFQTIMKSKKKENMSLNSKACLGGTGTFWNSPRKIYKKKPSSPLILKHWVIHDLMNLWKAFMSIHERFLTIFIGEQVLSLRGLSKVWERVPGTDEVIPPSPPSLSSYDSIIWHPQLCFYIVVQG